MLKGRCLVYKQYLGAIWPRPRAHARFQSSGTFLQTYKDLHLADLTSVISNTPSLSDVLLGRARAIVSEHNALSKQLSSAYDGQVARKVGELAETVQALREWETANSVSYVRSLGVDDR